MAEVIESNYKRRKGKEEIEFDGSPKFDPLAELGSDVMILILGCLDARSAGSSLLVSWDWHRLACRDSVWANLCEKLWLGKAHIPRISEARGLTKLAAYSLSVKDGKRTRIQKEDLWDHAWEFHYNMWMWGIMGNIEGFWLSCFIAFVAGIFGEVIYAAMAPEYFRNLDPYWNGNGQLMRRYFHPDGSQTADADDRLWGGHEAGYCIVTSFLDNDDIRAHYVRINRWPSLVIRRKENWGWEMSNNLYTYSSIPDAYKKGGTGPLSPAFRLTA